MGNIDNIYYVINKIQQKSPDTMINNGKAMAIVLKDTDLIAEHLQAILSRHDQTYKYISIIAEHFGELVAYTKRNEMHKKSNTSI